MPEGKEDEGKRGDRISKNELMERVQEFCVSDGFEKEFEAFAREHSDTFLQALHFDDDSTEHPLEFHKVYRDYLRRFEGLIEDFISTTGYSVVEFYEECKYILETDDLYGSKRFFIETMLATSEYENFFILMKAEMRLHASANASRK